MRNSARTGTALLFVLLVLGWFAALPSFASPEFDKAVSAYNNREYASALSQFSALSAKGNADPVTRYYTGLCYQMTNQVGRAKQEYEWVSAHSTDAGLKRNADIALQQLAHYQSVRNTMGSSTTGQSTLVSQANHRGAGRPRVIDFYTTWCGPCKRLAPVLQQIEKQYSSTGVSFDRIDCEAPENADLVNRSHIDAYPTVVFFDGRGTETQRLVGLYPSGAYVQAIEGLLGH